jgi:uncharacterized protein (TIGR03435 family)
MGYASAKNLHSSSLSAASGKLSREEGMSNADDGVSMRDRWAWGVRVAVPALALGWLWTPAAGAQAATAHSPGANVTLPGYDVVSIKPNRSGSGDNGISIDDGNFNATNVSLKRMILSAYGLKESQLEDLPRWAETDRFDIEAKIIEPDKKVLEALSPDQFREMRQPILTDRFALKYHREKKTLPVYELMVIKGGPKFKATTDAEQKSDKGVNGLRAGSISVHNTQLTATGVPLSSIADSLSGQLHRIVIDRTGLKGNYNVMLSWTADDGPANSDATAPTLFTALQEQLGLRLQPSKAEVDTFVVDHVELPTENE